MKNEKNIWATLFVLLATFFYAPLQAQDDNLIASNDNETIVILEPNFSPNKGSFDNEFEKKYHYLVARSYFKLLAEAQKSERKLKLQVEQFNFENEKYNREGSKSFQRKLNLVQKKYNAHTAMLSGLKSWNLFSDDRTGDMFYFMAENEERIFKMVEKKTKEEKMVRYLIYRLADLYHLEE